MDGGGVTLAFWALAGTMAISAGGVMFSRNLLHAVLFLIVTFLSVSGFFVLLSADFLAMAQVIIYVGAIAVLILFAVLLTPRAGRDNGETYMALPAVLLAVSLGAVLLFVIFDTSWKEVSAEPALGARELGDALLGRWALPFELASVLLTAALIGAIFLTRSPDEDREGRE